MVSNYDVHHHTTILISLHRYVGELIAAAAVGDSTSLKVMELLATEAVQQLLYGDISLKIALAAYTAIKKWEGGARAQALYAESGITLGQLCPSEDAARVAELTDRAGLTYLFEAPVAQGDGGDGDAGAGPAAEEEGGVGAAVEKMILSGASYDAVRAYVDKHVSPADRTDGRYVGELTEAVVSGVTSKTTLAAGTSVKEPTKEDEAAEAELLDSFKDLLRYVALSTQRSARCSLWPHSLASSHPRDHRASHTRTHTHTHTHTRTHTHTCSPTHKHTLRTSPTITVTLPTLPTHSLQW
jgi:hypothetical protein